MKTTPYLANALLRVLLSVHDEDGGPARAGGSPGNCERQRTGQACGAGEVVGAAGTPGFRSSASKHRILQLLTAQALSHGAAAAQGGRRALAGEGHRVHREGEAVHFWCATGRLSAVK